MLKVDLNSKMKSCLSNWAAFFNLKGFALNVPILGVTVISDRASFLAHGLVESNQEQYDNMEKFLHMEELKWKY